MLGEALSVFGFALQCLLAWRCLRARLWRDYPIFFGYLAYTLPRTAVLATLDWAGQPNYGWIYWLSDMPAVLLWLLIAAEVFHHVFPRRSKLRELAGGISALLLLVLAATYYLWSGSSVADIERKAGLAAAAWLCATLILARYYAVPVGRGLWGIAMGLGLLVSITIANFSAYDFATWFLPYWAVIRPVSFLGVTVIWLWAVWSYVPGERPGEQTPAPENLVVAWEKVWSSIGPTIRRAFRQ